MSSCDTEKNKLINRKDNRVAADANNFFGGLTARFFQMSHILIFFPRYLLMLHATG